MRVRNKLNVKQIAGLTAPGVYSDGGGLYLRVRPTGSRSWLFIYSMNRRRREMGLGSDLDVTLAQAREKAAEARASLLNGDDPQAARRQTKAIAPLTFGEFALELLDSIEDGFKNAKHRQQWRNTLTTYAAPLFPVAIAKVETSHVLEALQPIWLTKPETASRVRGRIERVLDAAKVKGLRSGENPARGRGHLDLLLPKRSKAGVQHHAALPFKEMGRFMAQLRTRPALAARALEFTILTAARSGETRGMTWGEIDFDARVWTIPGQRMKAGATHEVPLSDAAMAILQAHRPTEFPPQGIVFPAARGGTMPAGR